MAEAKEYPPVKLFFGLLVGTMKNLPEALRRLRTDFGEIDVQSEPHPFTHSTYYNKEMGDTIQRLFIATHDMIEMSELPDIKLYTNRIEMLFADEASKNRTINIDPGYLSLCKVVLATTKDYDHRLFLKSGIFGEVTLKFRKSSKSFEPWEWTYPDYREPYAIEFFNKLREIYHRQLNEEEAKKRGG